MSDGPGASRKGQVRTVRRPTDSADAFGVAGDANFSATGEHPSPQFDPGAVSRWTNECDARTVWREHHAAFNGRRRPHGLGPAAPGRDLPQITGAHEIQPAAVEAPERAVDDAVVKRRDRAGCAG